MSKERSTNPWYGDEDPFSEVGLARVIVVRHKPQYNFRGELDNCTAIMHVETFQYGFICQSIEGRKYGHGPSRWLDEEVSNSEHKINHLFKNLPIGIYELTGKVFSWSSQSYEGEWDGDSELRDTKIQEICFNDAVNIGGTEWFNEMSALILASPIAFTKDNFSEETDIHPFMTHEQILCNQANALTRIVHSAYHTRPSYKDLTIEQLENCIHMLMLQIDSEKQDMQPRSLEIDVMVQDTLKQHRTLMDPEF